MQTSKTDKFVYLFAYFLMFTMAINVDELKPDFVIGTVEEIQQQSVIMSFHQSQPTAHVFLLRRLWSQVLNNFVTPQVPKMPPKDRKVVVVGMTRMLTESEIMMREPNIQAW
jgi:exportin-2 (importin alpha re-exporter)